MRDFARGMKKRSGSDQDNSIGEPSHSLSLKDALQVANAILARPNRRFSIMEAVLLAHAKGWEEAELTKAERTLRNSGHHDQADEIRGVLQTDPLQPDGYIH
jgi:hypothetical protein